MWNVTFVDDVCGRMLCRTKMMFLGIIKNWL